MRGGRSVIGENVLQSTTYIPELQHRFQYCRHKMEIDPPTSTPEGEQTVIIKDDDLFKAASNGDVSYFKSLSQPQLLRSLTLRNEDGRSLLHVAVSSGRTEVVKILSGFDQSVTGINSADEEGWAPLHSAASSGNVEIVKILLDRGLNLIYPCDLLPCMRRPLFLVIDSGNSNYFKALSTAVKGEPVAMLLSPSCSSPVHGAIDPHQPSGSQFTSFLTAPLQAFLNLAFRILTSRWISSTRLRRFYLMYKSMGRDFGIFRRASSCVGSSFR